MVKDAIRKRLTEYTAGKVNKLMETGTLYIVATPIGNLEDITLRAIKTLKSVDIIAAEDTRQSIKLLNHFGIENKLTSYHEHNKYKKGEHIIEELMKGKDVAIVSDAGTPGISDPGEEIIKMAIANGIKVCSIPGPSAAISGLILSGLPTARFVFEGFLPADKKRRKRLEELKHETRTIILYEAPHKLARTLGELLDYLGNRNIAIVREMTKIFEEVLRIPLSEALEIYKNKVPKGEFVLVIEGAKEEAELNERRQEWSKVPVKEHVEFYIKSGMDRMEAIKQAAKDRGMSKRDVYRDIISQTDTREPDRD